MRKSDNPVVAIACADIHLSHTPPIARAGEPDWYAAMRRPLVQLQELQEELTIEKYIPEILCAGDIFHHWKSPPELLNFALKYLPRMTAIPGQHDLPNHALEDLNKSAYATMILSGRIAKLSECVDLKTSHIHCFPWGTKVLPPSHAYREGGINKICLHHAYRALPKADPAKIGEPSYLKAEEYKGYNTVIIGDNHISWDHGNDNKRDGKTYIFNCGSLMRRNSDQINHRPRVGLIHLDGSVESHYLDCSKDIISATAGLLERASETPISLARLQEQLKQLQGSTLDFIAVLRQTMDREDITPEVRQIIEEAIEGKP